MDLHYGRPLDLTATARAGELSKFHFIRLFKRAYGTTPHQYLSDVRINQAKKLLLTVATVMEVCLAVGFESPSSFTGFFKKATGRTPSEYRRRKKSNF
jgi:AraC-like DNA-binding protein